MNEKCNLVTVLLLCCLIFPGNAQEFNWQDLVNRKQYAAVIAHADSLTLADSSNYEIMNAIGRLMMVCFGIRRLMTITVFAFLWIRRTWIS